MVRLNRAIEIAENYYAIRGKQPPAKIYETEDMWIAFPNNENVRYGNSGITIAKDTGKIGRFILPSRENFEILRKAKTYTI